MLARIATRFPERAEDFAAGLSLGSELRESVHWSTAEPCSFIEHGDQRRPPSTAQRRPSAAILSPHWYFMAHRINISRAFAISAWLGALLNAPGAHAADAVLPPHVRAQIPPEWPQSSHSDRDIDVVVVVTVAADGSVLDAHVDDSAGADYDNAAIAAVKHWQFEPATRNGLAIPARVRALVHFELPAHEAAPIANPP